MYRQSHMTEDLITKSHERNSSFKRMVILCCIPGKQIYQPMSEMVTGCRENAATAWWFPGAYYTYKDRGFVLKEKNKKEVFPL